MRFNTFTDYSLRVLMYLGTQGERLTTIAEIARAHDISENHLMKVVHQLGRSGYLTTLRGKGGGMRLARPPEEIVLGDVVRQTETDMALVECFSTGGTCRVREVCHLKGILQEALTAMMRVLDSYTLADLLQEPEAMVKAIRIYQQHALPSGAPS